MSRLNGETKSCARCKQVKAHSEFTKDRSTPDGRSRWCKVCKQLSDRRYAPVPEDVTAELFPEGKRGRGIDKGTRSTQYIKLTSAEWLERKNETKRKQKIKDREYRLKKKYGITPKELSAMLESQDHQCLICDTRIDELSLHIDHCHDTDTIRGLLCKLCNPGLGYFKDDPEVLQKAANYLKTRPFKKSQFVKVARSPGREIVMSGRVNVL